MSFMLSTVQSPLRLIPQRSAEVEGTSFWPTMGSGLSLSTAEATHTTQHPHVANNCIERQRQKLRWSQEPPTLSCSNFALHFNPISQHHPDNDHSTVRCSCSVVRALNSAFCSPNCKDVPVYTKRDALRFVAFWFSSRKKQCWSPVTTHWPTHSPEVKAFDNLCFMSVFSSISYVISYLFWFYLLQRIFEISLKFWAIKNLNFLLEFNLFYRLASTFKEKKMNKIFCYSFPYFTSVPPNSHPVLSLWVSTPQSDWQRTFFCIFVYNRKEKSTTKFATNFTFPISDTLIISCPQLQQKAHTEQTQRAVTHILMQILSDNPHSLIQHREVLSEVNNLLHGYFGGQNSPSWWKINFPDFFLQLQAWAESVGVCLCVHNQSSLLNPGRNASMAMNCHPLFPSSLSLLPIAATLTLQNGVIHFFFLFYNSLGVILGIESKLPLFIQYSDMQETTPQLMKVWSISRVLKLTADFPNSQLSYRAAFYTKNCHFLIHIPEFLKLLLQLSFFYLFLWTPVHSFVIQGHVEWNAPTSEGKYSVTNFNTQRFQQGI